MPEEAIRISGIGKQYHIGAKRDKNRNMQEILTDAFVSPFRRAGRLLRGQAQSASDLDQTFWALRDVSFDVKHGEVLGILGRNGAGKSTLLKILSRVTEPTEGRAEIHGRIGSLLEVGTGFHPELTGRENLFLNGAILGMRKAEILRKFDEIVAFAEIDKFIDTPVKHYSSGMYVRLAFAVAAHLEPEILLIDEVLAVGDTNFQRKCLGKMNEVSRAGRTVIFISHSMAAVENLCDRGVLLEGGRLAFAGNMKQTIDRYLQGAPSPSGARRSHIVDLRDAPGRPAKCPVLLKRLEMFTDGDVPLCGALGMGNTFKVRIYFELAEPTASVCAGLGFDTLLGQRLFTAHSLFEPGGSWGEREGEQVFVCEIPNFTLVPSEYKIKVSLDVRNADVDWVDDAARLSVVESDFYGSGRSPWNGTCVMKHNWHLHSASNEEQSTIKQL